MFGRFFKKKNESPVNKQENDQVEFRDSDIFLVSYPKSGNTWVRHLVGNYMSNGEMDFRNGALLMPDIHYNPQDIKNIKFNPRFIKSHFPFRSEYKNVVYIARDGRDTSVSLFYFLKKLEQINLATTFSDYLENYFFAGSSPFGKWDDHVFSWLRDNKTSKVLLVKYEDLLSDPYQEMTRILEFSGVPIIKEKLKLAIEHSSFSEMQKDEKKNVDFLTSMGHKSGHVNYGIIREGKVNSWKNEFSEAEIKKFWELYGNAMTFLGYKQ